MWKSDILKAIDKAKNHLPSPPYILMPKWWVEEEMAAHPERFSVANDEDMTTTWCGYILYTCEDNMPEIEVEIIQHGRWIPTRPYMYSVKCSICGKIWDLETLRCPSCGAKMDLEEPINE